MKPFSAETRNRALELLSQELSTRQVQEQLGSPAPSTATLQRWRKQPQSSTATRRKYPPRVIGQVVANLLVIGTTRAQITQESGIDESTQRHWLARYAPRPDHVDLTDFDAVVKSTMDNVTNNNRATRKKLSQIAKKRRDTAPAPVFDALPEPPSSPVTPVPGMTAEQLPDDPVELKKMLMEERTRRAIAEGHLIMLGKGLVPDKIRDVADLICYLRSFDHQLCWLLVATGIARSTFHRWARRLIRPLPDPHARLKCDIDRIAAQGADANSGQHFVYGYRKIHRLLAAQGCRISEKIIRRHMRDRGLHPTRPTTGKYSSYQGENDHKPANLLLVQDDGHLPAMAGGFSLDYLHHQTDHPDKPLTHDFHADNPHQRLVTDITEFSCRDGKLYLSPLIDLYDGLPVSVAVATSPTMPLVISMLDHGLAKLPEGSCPIIHTDRGTQYRAHAWRNAASTIRADGAVVTRFVPSMSRKATSGDNAVAEGFFGTLTQELFPRKRHTETMTRAEVVEALDIYIDWYVWDRISTRVGYRTLAAHRGWDPQPKTTNAA